MAKVSEDDTRPLLMGCHENVVRFEIPVHDIPLVEVFYAFEDLSDDQGSIDVRDLATLRLYVREQVPAANKLLEDVSGYESVSP